jgi:DNA-binding transcriptional LysR family regulator
MEGIVLAELQDIHRLQAFVAVVEEGSLVAALKKLHITQPALSSRLKLLEESFHCELLERSGKGTRPTPMGRLVYRQAVEILRRMEDMQKAMDRHLHLGEGWVHLAGGATSVSGIFPNAIRDFRNQFPKIRFTLQEIDSHFATEMVRDGVCDCAIVTHNVGYGGELDKSLSEVEVLASMDDELVLVASPEHPLAVGARNLKALGKTLLPMHLNSQDIILPELGTPVREIVDGELRRVAARPQVVMTLKSTQSMLQMVEKNIGVTVVSRVAIPCDCHLEVLPVEGLRMHRKLVLIGPRDRTVMPAARRFLEFMKSRF